MAILKEKAISFFESRYYPIAVALAVFIGHTFSIELFSIILVFGSAYAALLLCDDLRASIAPIFMVTFSFSYKTFQSGWLGSLSFAIIAISAVVILFACFFLHIILRKKHTGLKELIRSKLFWGVIALSTSLLLNGFFNFSEYKPINIVFALLLTICFTLFFCLFQLGLKERKDTVQYLIYILYVVSLLMVAQMIVLLLRDAIIVDGSIVKESLIVGWGAWNNIGGMLSMLLPVHFYYAATKKHSYIFYGTALLSYLAIVFTLSRSSLLFSTLIMVICIVIICIKSKNVLVNRIITVCLVTIGIVGIILLWSKLSAILASYLNQGFSDNGRFDLYKHGIDNFLSHPIFGGGFASCPEDEFGHGIEPNRYHNTIIEMMATCGIAGLGAYLFHRYQTIRLFWKKRKSYSTVFLMLVVASLLLTSLLDNHFFNLYPTMYYAVILCVVEKCQKD